MNLKIKVSKVKYALLYGLLFLAAMNFQAKFFYFVYFSFFALLISQRKLRVNAATILYLLACCIMSVYNRAEGVLSMIRCLAPVCFYLVGFNSITRLTDSMPRNSVLEKAEKQGYWLIVAISAGSFAHYLLNYLYNFGDSLGRNTLDIWSGQRMAATGQNALACLMMGLAVAMFYLPRKKWYRAAAICMLGLMLMYNLVLSTRTMLVIMTVLLVVGFFFSQRKTVSTQMRKKTMRTILLLLVIVLVAYILNIGNIQTMLKRSLLFKRFGGSAKSLLDNASRTNIKLYFLKNLFQYPLGGLHLRAKYGFAHDLLLDGYDEYGAMTCLLLIFILIHGGLQLLRILRKSQYSIVLKLELLLICVAVWLEFTVEPILAGMQWLFSCYCLLNGCMAGLNACSRQWEKGEQKHHHESITD